MKRHWRITVWRKSVIGIHIARRMPRDFSAKRVVIGQVGEVVAILRKGRAAFVGDDLQSETRQFEITHDLAAQKRADIRAVGIGPAVHAAIG